MVSFFARSRGSKLEFGLFAQRFLTRYPVPILSVGIRQIFPGAFGLVGNDARARFQEEDGSNKFVRFVVLYMVVGVPKPDGVGIGCGLDERYVGVVKNHNVSLVLSKCFCQPVAAVFSFELRSLRRDEAAIVIDISTCPKANKPNVLEENSSVTSKILLD